MKLSNFYDKDRPLKRQARQTTFTLSNGRLELELKEEQDKNQILQEQHIKFLNEQDELKGKINVLQEHSNSTDKDLGKITSTLDLKEAYYNEAQEKIQVIPDLQNHIVYLESNNTNLSSIIETAQKNSMQQGADLEAVTRQKESLLEEKVQTDDELEQRRKDVSSFQAKADEFKEKFEGIQTVMDTFKVEYKETQRSRNALWDQATYWEGKATEFYERVQAIEEMDVKLRQWIADLQTDSTESQSASKNAKQKIAKLMALISDMGKTIGDLTSDKDYLSQMNSALKKELSKPKFMSMGAIAKREGFKMPTSKENLRTKFLGNSAPTLLKFKGKEENNAR
jgi:chromosome segregation ATPase